MDGVGHGAAVSMGQSFWDCAVRQGAVLYLRLAHKEEALEAHRRGQQLLSSEPCNDCKGRLDRGHRALRHNPSRSEARLYRHTSEGSKPIDDSIYAAGYGYFSALKVVADKHSPAMMVVHHIRKMVDVGIINTMPDSSRAWISMVSIWALKKTSRGAGKATLMVAGCE